jgi:hypothetical protein
MQGEKKIVTTQGKKQTITKIRQRTSNNKSKVKSKHQQKQSDKQMQNKTIRNKTQCKKTRNQKTLTRPKNFLGFISFSTHNPHGGGAIVNLKRYNF